MLSHYNTFFNKIQLEMTFANLSHFCSVLSVSNSRFHQNAVLPGMRYMWRYVWNLSAVNYRSFCVKMIVLHKRTYHRLFTGNHAIYIETGNVLVTQYFGEHWINSEVVYTQQGIKRVFAFDNCRWWHFNSIRITIFRNQELKGIAYQM